MVQEQNTCQNRLSDNIFSMVANRVNTGKAWPAHFESINLKIHKDYLTLMTRTKPES